jgi:hypothetical protein
LLFWRLYGEIERGAREGVRAFLVFLLVLMAAASRSFERTAYHLSLFISGMVGEGMGCEGGSGGVIGGERPS